MSGKKLGPEQLSKRYPTPKGYVLLGWEQKHKKWIMLVQCDACGQNRSVWVSDLVKCCDCKCKSRDKIKATCLERYGVDHTHKSPEIIKKVRDSMESKYGCWASQSEEVKKKVQKTSMERYGVEYPFRQSR